MSATEAFSLDGKRVFVAGHNGMVGSALVRRLMQERCTILTAPHEALDLRRQRDTELWFARERPDAVIVAAGTVGGMFANDARPATFLYDNLMIAANVIGAAHQTAVEKLLYLGSSCIYPRDAAQPMQESALLSGPLEPTNIGYAIAKIAGIQYCAALRRQHGRNFISCQPTNLYGPQDNFDLATSHVLPALIHKAHLARESGARVLDVLGSGRARREFLFVDDLADACVFLLRHYDGDTPINIGWGADTSIADLAALIAEVVGFDGELRFDPAKGDGAPRKLLDVTRINALGWTARTPLRTGIARTYDWFLDHYKPGGTGAPSAFKGPHMRPHDPPTPRRAARDGAQLP
jgi:GDP-L-fucose synthase